MSKSGDNSPEKDTYALGAASNALIIPKL